MGATTSNEDVMSNQRLLMAGSSVAVLLALSVAASPGHAFAADTVADPADASTAVDEIVVKARDKAGLIETRPNNTVFGIDKPLLETPRSASFVSDTTLQRYGIETIDGLTAVSPGTYTASFYGVPGALNIRGTLAENYFRGFKRIENRAPIPPRSGRPTADPDRARPADPDLRLGQGGRHANFIPKSGKNEGGYLSEPTGEVTATFGSYNRKNATAQVGLPVEPGSRHRRRLRLWRGRGQPQLLQRIYPRRQTGEIRPTSIWATAGARPSAA